ncbi:MAG: aminopeptidase P family protein [Verrucomicrobia bacterium]|nr:aminopeptidase P family protein [Verrucomicrobiota bacterium]
MPKVARLIVGNTDRFPDLTYATGLFVPDDFAWFQTRSGKTFTLLGPLEIDRARRTARVDQCLDLSAEEKRLGPRKCPYPQLLASVLRRHGIFRAVVPGSFPIGLAQPMAKFGVRLHPISEPFFPERIRKTTKEIQAITSAIRSAEAGLSRAVEVLRSSRIGKNKVLRWNGSTLTSEMLRAEMEVACLRHGAIAKDTIVAGGNQACDPHERGSGPLRAHQAIILDIFPRNPRTGYFGDITRTLVKGTPSDRLSHLRETVHQGQMRVIRQTRAGADGAKIQQDLRHWFTAQGYPTGIQKGRWQGFFHGVGHGLGLEIHESPRFAVASLPMSTVITLEPGLYVPGIGGVRIEDVFLVQKGSCRRLTQFPNLWRIP